MPHLTLTLERECNRRSQIHFVKMPQNLFCLFFVGEGRPVERTHGNSGSHPERIARVLHFARPPLKPSQLSKNNKHFLTLTQAAKPVSKHTNVQARTFSRANQAHQANAIRQCHRRRIRLVWRVTRCEQKKTSCTVTLVVGGEPYSSVSILPQTNSLKFESMAQHKNHNAEPIMPQIFPFPNAQK